LGISGFTAAASVVLCCCPLVVCIATCCCICRKKKKAVAGPIKTSEIVLKHKPNRPEIVTEMESDHTQEDIPFKKKSIVKNKSLVESKHDIETQPDLNFYQQQSIHHGSTKPVFKNAEYTSQTKITQ
jgi:hypothetical protein